MLGDPLVVTQKLDVEIRKTIDDEKYTVLQFDQTCVQNTFLHVLNIFANIPSSLSFNLPKGERSVGILDYHTFNFMVSETVRTAWYPFDINIKLT
jgi:hypothetical protein